MATVTITYSVSQTTDMPKDMDVEQCSTWDLVEIFNDIPFELEDLNTAEPILVQVHDENGFEILERLF